MNYKSFNLGDWIGHISGVIEDETTLDGNEMRDLVEFLSGLPKWIPVSDPPKKLGTYLIQTDGEYMCECRWTDVNPYWTDKKTKPHWNIFDIPQYSKVVAWMPLPEPYRAESDEI